ncbi:MAG: hypothetical protein EOO69_08085 [Moraxellaceae bacterium]|nr:MAG: hypothetical protein EOO69_08085 [Moraxellaceae bacterium]
MPSLSPYSLLAKYRLNQLSHAIVVGMSAAFLLAGCGGDSPTTRTTEPTTETPAVTYKLTVTSPVKLKNALVSITDASTGKQLDQKTISDGSDVSFDIAEAYAKGGRVLIAKIAGKDNSSLYFDTALGKMASLNMPLHGTLLMLPVASSTIVSPFTEIAYQRMLVRANNLDASKPDLSQIKADDLALALAFANREVSSTFRVNPATLVPTIGSLSDLSKFIIDTKDVINPPNTTFQYLNIFFAAGHIKLQQVENPSDSTPMLTFAKRAGADMRDGSLDGMGLAGDGKNGTVFLENPIISQQIVNTDPNFNNRTNTAELKEALATTQQAARESYATRLGGAETDANKNKLGGAMAQLFASLSKPDPAGKDYFTQVDFVTGTHPTINEGAPSVPSPRSFGAGNYKHAFGLGSIKLTKEPQKIRNSSCALIDSQVDPKAEDKDHIAQTQNIDCEIGANADGTLGNYNVIENLVGTYTGDNQCKLDIYFNGDIKLTNGQKTFSSSINRDESDATIRLQPNSQDYVLNVSSAERNPPEILQLRITNQNIVSATTGILDDKNNPFPQQIARGDIVCSGFKPVFTKP